MKLLARKLGFYIVAAWFAATLDFLLPRLIPGSPVDAFVSREESEGFAVSPSEIHTLNHVLGTGHGGLWTDYVHYWSNIVHLNFGRSLTYFPTPVSTIVRQSLPWTIALVGTSILLSGAIGTAAGIFLGWRRGSRLELLAPASAFLSAIPYFWLALVLVYLLGSTAHVLPIGGGAAPGLSASFTGAFIISAITHAILPATTIVISSVAGWLITMRNLMVTTLAEDYVVAAEAKGLPSSWIMLGYAARNAVLPQITSFAISLGFVVSGSIVMEIVFSYPGIGYQLYQAVENNDYPLMQAIFLVTSMTVLAANLIADLLNGIVDPRTRSAE